MLTRIRNCFPSENQYFFEISKKTLGKPKKAKKTYRVSQGNYARWPGPSCIVALRYGFFAFFGFPKVFFDISKKYWFSEGKQLLFVNSIGFPQENQCFQGARLAKAGHHRFAQAYAKNWGRKMKT